MRWRRKIWKRRRRRRSEEWVGEVGRVERDGMKCEESAKWSAFCLESRWGFLVCDILVAEGLLRR